MSDDLGMKRRITRRNFLNGVLRAGVVSAALPFLPYAAAEEAEFYPPALTGLRGSTIGTFEVAHQLRDGDVSDLFKQVEDTKETYDLVIVGAGISGLASAYFYSKAAGPKA